MTNSDRVIAAVLVAVVLASLWIAYEGTQRFTQVCEAAGGVVVFDGRQYQCIRPKEGASLAPLHSEKRK
jgi:hypothetical protein